MHEFTELNKYGLKFDCHKSHRAVQNNDILDITVSIIISSK